MKLEELVKQLELAYGTDAAIFFFFLYLLRSVAYCYASRRALKNIAAGWIEHDQVLQSPRPGKFRARLECIRMYLKKAHVNSDLNGENATTFDRHLLHWLMESQLPGMWEAMGQLALLPQTIEFLKRAEETLPRDSGSARPLSEERFVGYLTDQFEANGGGKARAYWSEIEGRYKKTPFRQFAQKFYSFLLLKSRRTRKGFDEVLRKAVTARQRRNKKSG